MSTSDNDLNALKLDDTISGRFHLKHLLTNTSSWFLKTDCPDGLKYFQRDPLETDVFVDMDTDSVEP